MQSVQGADPHPYADDSHDGLQESVAASEDSLGSSWLEQHYRVDLRTEPPDVFEDLSQTDWARLTRRDVGDPYLVRGRSRTQRLWERDRAEKMPVPVQWEYFNRCFHDLFLSDDDSSRQARMRFCRQAVHGDVPAAWNTAAELLRLKVWRNVHRVDDAVWDPRGKRALFEGLESKRPRVLFLGAADGYEAMQLLAQYPGGSAVMVDYDDFCRTDRYGRFPERYPFLGSDPATGSWRVYRKVDFDIDFVVEDIRNLRFGPEFDIVLSVGLLEHFPDEHKPLVFEAHRRFLKPGGYAVMTTPRRQLRSKAFYWLMNDLMNFGYRELMDARQLGLYAYENGFDILRCGYIKAHNGIVARPR